MTVISILSRFRARLGRYGAKQRLSLNDFSENPYLLPALVSASPLVMGYLDLLGSLDWDRFPERDLRRDWGRQTPLSWLPA